MQINKILTYLDERFPKDTACDFDQAVIGLTIGSRNIEVKKVLFALDLTIDVCKEAKEKGANLIITHHPFLFNPISKVLFDNPQGEIIKFMCENNLSTYSMHTNLDCAVGGVNDTLCKMLGLDFEHEESLKDEILRCGYINEITMKDLIEIVKEKFSLKTVKYIGDLNEKIKKIGIVGGSGAQIPSINDAIKEKVDCYITGEVKLNAAIYAKQMGLNLIEVNHGIERFVFYSLKEELEKIFGDIFIISDINTDPLIGC